MAGYIGSKASVVSSGVERKKTYSITGSTTSLTGLNYTVGKVHVFQNGVRLLDGTDYTATNGTSITLTVAAQSGDNVVVVSQASFQLSESYTSTESDARYVQPTHTGNLDITGTVNADGLNVQNGSNAGITFDVSTNYTPVIKGSQSVSDLYLEAVGGGGFRVSTTDKPRLFIQNNGDVSFYEDTGTTAKFFWDASAERLGIGTNNPSAPLTVETSATTNVDIKTSATNGTAQLRFSNDARTYSLGIDNSDSFFVYDATGTSTRMTIDSSGNIGIGTSSPSGKLSIAGNSATDEKSHITFENTQGAKKFAIGGGKSGVTNNGFAVVNVTDNTAPLLITDSGNVGIGTSSPSYKLDVASTVQIRAGESLRLQNVAGSAAATIECAGAGTNSDLRFRTASAERMRIDSSGRVTKPYHPSFTARSPNGGSTNSGGTDTARNLLFTSIINNNGSHYNSANGRFTAPVTGHYYFAYNLLWDDSYNGTGFFTIRKNNSYHAQYSYVQDNGTHAYGYIEISGSAVVQLNANEWVTCYANIPGIHVGGESNFTGFLLG